MDELENLELRISKFLRLGVIISGGCLLLGWLSGFDIHANPFNKFRDYEELQLKDALIIYFQTQQWGVLLSYFGLILLIFLPFIRVALTSLLFIKQKEYPLALIAGAVLLGLIVSFSFGIEL